MSDDHTLTLRVAGPKTDVMKLLANIPGVVKVTCLGMQETGSNDFVIEPDGTTDIRRNVFNRLAERNWPLLMIHTNELTLEQIFLRLTEMTKEEKEHIFQLREQAKAEEAAEVAEVVVTEIAEEEEVEE